MFVKLILLKISWTLQILSIYAGERKSGRSKRETRTSEVCVQSEQKEFIFLDVNFCKDQRLFTVPYFSVRSQMWIVELDGSQYWSLNLSETGESTKCPWVGGVEGTAGGPPYPKLLTPPPAYPRAFCTLPSFARIKRPRWRPGRTERSASTISWKNKGL